ncbi:hypothetical protein FBQ87_08850 [Sphingobacteriales bacterium CHB3]|nr:hypothetical protein [Sphingobacteriales bacterium CHB3]
MATTRVTADFDAEAYKALNEVAELLGTTKADAIRRALGLSRYVLKQKHNGKKLILEDEDGKDKVEIVTL